MTLKGRFFKLIQKSLYMGSELLKKSTDYRALVQYK